jgi:hypothetical protein
MVGADRRAMRILARHLLPIVERRRRPNHQPGGGAASERPREVRAPAVEPASPSRALAVVALAVLRRVGRPESRPARWTSPGFAREVDLIRLHLAPIRSRPVLAASFGREAFHGDESSGGAASTPTAVTVAYAIRWLELGDGAGRPSWAAWLAESSAVPVTRASEAATPAIAR